MLPLPRRSNPAALFLLLLTLSLATPKTALGVDGVIEINQAAALAGSVTPGDEPGFPVSLFRPGSYRLTSNLSTETRALSAIFVAANDVTLDLNGFTIACTFATRSLPEECTTVPGAGRGVDVAVGVIRTRVRNGSVRGMGNEGIRLGADASVQDVAASQNGTVGIRLGLSGEVERSIAANNVSSGISVGSGSAVRGCRARSNGGNGLEAGDGSVVIDNSVEGSTANGIVASASVVSRNAVSGSGSSGIVATSFATVVGNHVSNSGIIGIILGTGSGYANNSVSQNGFEAITGGVATGGNACDGAPCP